MIVFKLLRWAAVFGVVVQGIFAQSQLGSGAVSGAASRPPKNIRAAPLPPGKNKSPWPDIVWAKRLT